MLAILHSDFLEEKIKTYFVQFEEVIFKELYTIFVNYTFYELDEKSQLLTEIPEKQLFSLPFVSELDIYNGIIHIIKYRTNIVQLLK